MNDDSDGFLNFNYVKHVLQGQRLKVEPVRGVVVGGDGLRITINHNAFVTFFLQRVGSVNTAVVKFNPLADAVWSAAQDNHLLLFGHPALVVRLVGGVIIRLIHLKFPGAGIN